MTMKLDMSDDEKEIVYASFKLELKELLSKYGATIGCTCRYDSEEMFVDFLIYSSDKSRYNYVEKRLSNHNYIDAFDL